VHHHTQLHKAIGDHSENNGVQYNFEMGLEALHGGRVTEKAKDESPRGTRRLSHTYAQNEEYKNPAFTVHLKMPAVCPILLQQNLFGTAFIMKSKSSG
jgi:hypothetical protein